MFRSLSDNRSARVVTSARTVVVIGVVIIGFVGIAAGTFAAATIGRVIGKVMPRKFRPGGDTDSDGD